MSEDKKKKFDITYKVLVVGESTVGKSSIIRMFSKPGKKLPSLVMTIGIDFVNIIQEVDNIRVRLQIWDTAGQERFRTFTKMHFRGTKGIILVYDITNKNTFEKLTSWLKDVGYYGLNKEQLIIVGNKTDLVVDREVSKEIGEKLAYEFGFKFFETSAKDNINVQEVFHELARDMKDANDPYFVVVGTHPGDKFMILLQNTDLSLIPIIHDPRFDLDVAKIDVVDSGSKIRVIKDETPDEESSSTVSYSSRCCSR